jgi:hypothetical protein
VPRPAWSRTTSARALEKRQIGIRFAPHVEELAIGGIGSSVISREGICATELEMRQCADRIARDNETMADDPLELRRGLRTTVLHQVRLAPEVNRVQRSEQRRHRAARHPQFVRSCHLQDLHGALRVLAGDRQLRPEHRKCAELNRRVLRVARFQLSHESLGTADITGPTERERGPVHHLTIV